MRAIVSLATHEPHYYMALERLQKSLKGNFNGKFLPFRLEKSVCAPLHSINNYAFKIFAIAHAKRMGFKQVFWLDTSNYAVKNVDPIFDHLYRECVFLEDSGHSLGEWSNDACLDHYHITRQQALDIKMISSGFVGIDFTTTTGTEFFWRWSEAMTMGLFNGSWDNHRHDQTCASIIAWQMGLKLSPDRTYFAHVGPGYVEPRETAVFHLQGI